jgi:antitoxin HicB
MPAPTGSLAAATTIGMTAVACLAVTCRDLPALVTQGEDRRDALAQAADAMDEVFATLTKLDKPFPPPSKARRGEPLISPPVETVAKAALYSTLREAKITEVQLAKWLGIDEKEVRRLLDPHYHSKLPRIAEAISLLGKRLVISLESV